MNLKKGQTLVASLEAHHTLRSPMDAVLQIVSADGFVLEENNDWRGLDPQIAYAAPKDGLYVARVFAFPAQPDSSIRHFGSDACVYRLTLTTGAFADFAMPLAVSPHSAAVELRGWNLSELPKLLPAPRRPDGDTHVTFFDPRITNPIRLRVEAHRTGVWSEYKPGDGSSLVPLLKPPASVSAVIDKSKELSVIAIVAKKGQPLTIQAESRSLGLAVNPVVRVLDSDRKQLTRAEPAKLNGDTALSFSPPADGGYTVEVSDLYGGGGSRHAFLLRVLSEPDYELSVTADRFTAEPGKPTVVAVTVNRLRGFAKPVDVTAEGLPDGAKVEIVQPAKPNPNVLTLNISSEKPVSGAFRLVGAVKGEPSTTRVARAPLTEFEATTADLWFTSTATKK